jgi:hypothetical protein
LVIENFKMKIMERILRKIAVTISFVAVITASSCNVNGKVIEVKKDVSDFTSVELAVAGKLLLSQGNEYSLVIKAEEDVLDRIEVFVEGGKLRIKTKRDFGISFINDRIEAHLTMPFVEGLAIAGSGDIEAVTSVVAKSLKVSIAGSGSIKVTTLTLENLSASIAGSGDIIMNGKGSASDLNVSIAGSGDVLVNGIIFNDANISIAGSGNASIESKENLKARVAGSGDIYYKGNPFVDAKISGSGRVKSQKNVIL